MPSREGPRKLDYATPGEEEPRESRIPPIVFSLGKIAFLLIALIGATWLVAYVLSIVNPIKGGLSSHDKRRPALASLPGPVHVYSLEEERGVAFRWKSRGPARLGVTPRRR